MSLDKQNILDEFVTESREHLADIESDLLNIEAAGADADSELVNRVFRAIHSIKGASGFLGLNVIGELSHSLENVLNLIRARELVPTTAAVDVLLRAVDTLRSLINNVDQSNGVDVSAHVAALKQVIAGGTTSDVRDSMQRNVQVGDVDKGLFEISEHTLATHRKFGNHLYAIDIDLVADVDAKEQTPIHWVKQLTAIGEILDARLDHAAWGSLDSKIPTSIRFLALVATVMEIDLFQAALNVPLSHIHEIPTIPRTAAPAAATPIASAPAAAAKTIEPACAESVGASITPPPAKTDAMSDVGGDKSAANIRVSVNLLDHLMNLAGELVLGRNQLMQALNTGHHDGLQSIAGRLDQVTSELQEAIMQTRMQPIGTVFNKFPRIVRDLSAKLGKQCELTIDGKDVELDKSISEAIGDPLTHLVRNSVDHGVETPDVRQSRGKNPVGKVALRAFHQAGKINIVITDDGAGIDAKKLKEKAVAKGVISADDAREMSEREAIRLIFHPGFSMAEKVTDVSGRGVGMDVVRTNIEKLGGTVNVDTQVGQGTTIHIKLPLTLAIIPSLIVRCGHEPFAIPQVNINELVRIKPSEVAKKIEKVKKSEVLRLRGALLPLIRLSKALNMQSAYLEPISDTLQDNHRVHVADRRSGQTVVPPEAEARSGKDRREDVAAGAVNIIVVESGHIRYGLIVDEVQDSEEIVVKPLSRHLKGCSCLAGATVLGDGKVALILDIAGIGTHEHLTITESDASLQDEAAAAAASGSETHAVLLFTNDLTEQFAVPMSAIARIERIQTTQIDSVGGQEILQYRGSSLPLLSLEKLVKAKPRPQQSHAYVVVYRSNRQEIGLIAPNLVDIRNVSTEIDMLTFREPGVAGSMVVENRATRVLDLFELAQAAHPEWFTNAAPVETTTAGGGTARVLLAEDSGFFRNQVGNFLTSEGYEVIACEDGLVAWNALISSELPFDIVVTDIEMPNLSGYELARKIRQTPQYAALPIIAVTSLAGEEDMKRGLEAGIDSYQVKLDRDELMAAVNRLLAARVSAAKANKRA